MNETSTAVPPPDAPYRVLARKYRPAAFAEMIGQEAMVRTLSNAFASQRIAHAFILTGVRGVGKTTTARIIARALNCVGADGNGGPTVTPCGVCVHCRSIAEDRHVDVLEMDAASRTGVNDIRELLDGVRYKPVSARYKVYILDEVHMLSDKAFNALLKTLEEPPPDVKFVFATTEIRKVPVTVLSRCQRFDLRRIGMSVLAKHLETVVAKEGLTAEPAALSLIARAADGSARDALSLLDQAIALSPGPVAETSVAAMLGMVDRGEIFRIFEATMRGRTADALDRVVGQYRGGSDPLAVVQDLLDVTHLVTRLKAAPQAVGDMALSEIERTQGQPLADSLDMPVLARAWQILLKGVAEVQHAPVPLAALEMLMVRLAHLADLPTPGDLVRRLEPVAAVAAVLTSPSQPPPTSGPRAAIGGGASIPSPRPRGAASPATAASPRDFAEVAALFRERREAVLAAHLDADAHLVHFEAGRLELRLRAGAPQDLANRVGQRLSEWTGRRWIVSLSQDEGQPTLDEQRRQVEDERFRHAAEHPLVKAALATFPGAVIEAVRDLRPPPAPSTEADGESAQGDDEP
jgi:DNA polymerase-3 subunit gamma/tau